MFLKVTRSKNYQYLQLVESYRDGKKVRHRVIATLGRLDKLKADENFVELARKLLRLLESDDLLLTEDNIREADRLNWGWLVYKKLWDKFKMDDLLEEHTRNRKIKFNFKLSVFLMILFRLMYNDSKKRGYERQGILWGMEEKVGLNHFYRSLDILSGIKEELEESLYFRRLDLFNQSIDVVYYDVTTFRFESVKSDGLRDFGYSKDGKPNEVQVVLGLLIDKEGRPVGYELYSGKTFEGNTLVDSLNKLKKRFRIDKVIVVADRGLNSKLNLHLIKEAGYDYILSVRLKGLSKKLKEAVLDPEDYIVDESSGFMCKELEHVTKVKVVEGNETKVKEYKDRLICTYSAERAEHDRHERERLIEKARKLMSKPGAFSSKRGARKYLKTEGKEKIVSLDGDRIDSDAAYDGYYVLITSDFKLSSAEVYDRYHNLWKIEESFRVLKSTMRTRPIYHWTESRIKGHFVVCFLGFMLERELELKLKEKGISASPDKIKEALKGIEVSLLKINDDYYYLKGKTPELGKKILNALRVKHLPNFFKKDSAEQPD